MSGRPIDLSVLLARGHADGAVEADVFTVEAAVGDIIVSGRDNAAGWATAGVLANNRSDVRCASHASAHRVRMALLINRDHAKQASENWPTAS